MSVLCSSGGEDSQCLGKSAKQPVLKGSPEEGRRTASNPALHSKIRDSLCCSMRCMHHLPKSQTKLRKAHDWVHVTLGFDP